MNALRRIIVCADDYGISIGVNTAIRSLIAHRRINAASVMVAAPGFHRSDAVSLAMLNAGSPHAAIGLHVTLTAPFKPLTAGYAPLRDGAFLPLQTTLARALARRLRAETLRDEIAAQFDAFQAAFHRPPDFVDGHQHVHLFPQVRDALLAAVKARAPQAWVRQCRRNLPLRERFADRKGLLLDALSRGLRRRARTLGLRTNPAFAGTYDYSAPADFGALFPRFIETLPDGGVVMCHPGFVDGELARLDPLTDQREREHAFLAGDDFPAVLAAGGVTLSLDGNSAG
jgi:predicted glycoside hydrolase/deacetylase ChbG (UPF0249 family)